MQVLIVDGANVMGSRPDGWWRDRAAAARRLQERCSAAVLPYDEIVLILEGKARLGIPAGQDGCRTVHARRQGMTQSSRPSSRRSRSVTDVTLLSQLRTGCYVTASRQPAAGA